MARLRCLLLAASCLVCLQSADVGRAVRGAVAVVAVDLAVRSRSPSREPPLPREGRGSRSQGRDGTPLAPEEHAEEARHRREHQRNVTLLAAHEYRNPTEGQVINPYNIDASLAAYGGGLLRLRQRIKTFWSEEPVGWYIGRITVSDGERLEIKYDNGDRESFLVSDDDVVYELIDEQAFVFDSRSLTDQLKDQRFDDQWYQFLGSRSGRGGSGFKLDLRPRYGNSGGYSYNPLRKTERVVWALCKGQTPLAVCFDTVANDGARLRAIWTVRGAVGEALQRGWKLWCRAQTNGASSISVVVLYAAFEVKDRQINLRTTDVSTEHHRRRWPGRARSCPGFFAGNRS